MRVQMTKDLYRASKISIVNVRRSQFEKLREYQIVVQTEAQRHWFLETLKDRPFFKRFLKDPEPKVLATTGSGTLYSLNEYAVSAFCRGSLERCEGLVRDLEECFGGDEL